MFENIKFTKNIKEQYDNLIYINNEIKKLDKDLKYYYKNVPKDIKKGLKNLIYFPTKIDEIELLKSSRFQIINSLKSIDKETNEKIYLDILNEIRKVMLETKEDYEFDKELAFTNTFYILSNVKNIDKILKGQEDNAKNIYKNILDIIRKQNLEYILTLDILIQNINVFMKNTSNFDLLNRITNIMRINNNPIKSKQIYNIFKNYEDKYTNFNSTNAISNIKLLINYIDKDYKEEKIDNYLLKIIETVYEKIIYSDFPYELLKIVLNIITLNDKDNNIKLIIKLLVDDNFVYMKNKELQTNIIDTIISLDLKDEQYIDKITKIINNIINDTKNNKNEEVNKYVLNKIKEIKLSKTLDILLDIYPFLNKYTNEEDTINIIKTLPKGNTLTKKLVIPISIKD